MADLFKADGARVLADLNALRAIGAYKSGVHRPTFSEPHIHALNWLAQKLPDAGLTPEIDGIGNVFGVSTKAGSKLLAGSHLESQNFAGWLDGPVGVIYALEAARVINHDPGIKGAVEVACWCDEEGHFGHFLGSRSFVGDVTEQEIDAARDRTDGRPLREAIDAAGLADRPRKIAQTGRHIGYLEAHIEQGRTLEGSHLSIGIVTSIVGIWQYRITFTGEQNHAGTTPMKDRKDAGLALARLCVAIDDRFPARAEMLFQIRDDNPDVVERLEDLLREIAAAIGDLSGCSVEVTRLRTGKAAMMNANFQHVIEQAASIFGAKSIRMRSGAGHDAQVLATIMPAGMLFVPSIGGISH